MNYDDIKKLIDEMGTANIDELKVEFPDGVKISMKKNSNTVVTNAPIPTTVPTSVTNNNVITTSSEEVVANDKEEKEDYKIIKSPMVGTFYSSASPTSQPFVKVGDKVKKGQVVCIIEAMKLMNEIESEYDGEVVEICAKDEEVVDYGKSLFKIK